MIRQLEEVEKREIAMPDFTSIRKILDEEEGKRKLKVHTVLQKPICNKNYLR